jgi:hypothetical protein
MTIPCLQWIRIFVVFEFNSELAFMSIQFISLSQHSEVNLNYWFTKTDFSRNKLQNDDEQ